MKVSVRLEGFTAEQDQTVRTAIAGVLDGLFPEHSKTFEGVEQGKEYWQSQLKSGSVAVDQLQGCVTGYAINPLESAIDQTVRLIGEKCDKCRELASAGQPSGRLVEVLGSHLDALLAIQLERVTADGVQTDDEVSEQIAALQQSVRVIHGRQDRVFLATGIEGA